MRKNENGAKIPQKKAGRPTGRWILLYTLLYLLLVGLLVLFFKVQNRSLVYHADAWRQHLRALAYYGKWLRGNVWHFVHDHSLSVQSWSFGLGYGADVLTTLHYYCIGEPLTFLTILVPEKYTKYYFEFLILLRPYLAGLAFSFYAEYMLSGRKALLAARQQKRSKRKNLQNAEAMKNSAGTEENLREDFCTGVRADSRTDLCTGMGILAGALCYAFSGTVLYLGMLHPFFVTPMIYLPLLLLGVERVLREKRPRVLLISVWLAGLSNFYFFYMLALLTAGYAVVRTAAWARGTRTAAAPRKAGNAAIPVEGEKKKAAQQTLSGKEKKCTSGRQEDSFRKRFFGMLLHLVGYAACGTMAAGAVLVPILVQFRSDPRSATAYGLPLFYEKEYYAELWKNAVTFLNHPLYDTELCLSAVCIGAVVLLFFLRGHRLLKAAVLILILMLCLPAAGFLMNGGAYVINRWTFAAEFLFAFVLTVVWREISCGRAEWILPQRGTGLKATSTDRFQTAASVRRPRRGRKGNLCGAGILALMLVVLTIAGNIAYGYARIPAGANGDGGQSGFPSEFTDEQTPEEYERAAYRNEAAAAGRYAAQTGTAGFYRYTGRDLTYNAGAQAGISSTQFCWSLANGAVADFFEALGVCEEQNFSYTGVDDRAALEALAGAEYYTIAYDNDYEKQFVPYGFADCGTVPGDYGLGLIGENTSGGSEENAADGSGEHAADGKEGTAGGGTAEASIQEESGAVYGDDSWEPVVPTYHLYQNAFALPLGYTYTGMVPRSEFDAMDLTERQEALLQGVVLEEEDEKEAAANVEAVSCEFSEEERNFTVETGDGVRYSDEGSGATADQKNSANCETEVDPDGQRAAGAAFIVTAPGAKAVLHFEAGENAETYLVLKDLNVEPLTGEESAGSPSAETDETAQAEEIKGQTEETGNLQELYPITVTASRDGVSLTDKTLNYKTPLSQYYSGWKDFALNMGYRTEGADTLEITFQNPGVYRVTELSVVCQPVEEMMKNAVELSVCTMTETDLHQNPVSLASREITGEVNAEQDRYLVFSIPYSEGWTAYDNGKKVMLQKANLMYLGMPLSAGSHEIRLVYHTPGGRAGILASLAGVTLIFLLVKRSRKA